MEKGGRSPGTTACLRTMQEPLDFLDTAITPYSLTPPLSRSLASTPSAAPAARIDASPPPSTATTAAEMEKPDDSAADGPDHLLSHCRHLLRPSCCCCCCCLRPLHLRRRRPRVRAPHYRRPNSSLKAFGNVVYSYLQSFGGGSSRQQPCSRRELSPLDKYEMRLSRARWAARSVGSFYNLSTFFALCSLTWATVVLLGAFVDNLFFMDYAIVTSLLILEAVRLASAASFTILLTHGLARSSQDPQNIIHGRDDHYRRALVARILSSLLQAVLIAPSFVCPIFRFNSIGEYSDRNIYISLFIFYLVVLCNAAVSSITLFFSSASFIYLRDRSDQSILRYYDELVQRAISTGVIQADDFEFIHFAYGMLGKEFARIVQPEAVVKNHRSLIEYLYRHRLGQDFLLIYLNDSNAFVQQAAVNMVGFWADPNKMGLQEVKLSSRVLIELADKVGSGQVGWAAINSFGGVARRDASILAATRTSSGMPLLERLSELVDGRSSASLVFVRTLVLFYHYSYQAAEQRMAMAMEMPILQRERELVGKLRELLRTARVHRARLYSAYLLHLLGKLDACCSDDVAGIRPTMDTYWFQVEWDLLLFIRERCGMHEPPSLAGARGNFIRAGDSGGPRLL